MNRKSTVYFFLLALFALPLGMQAQKQLPLDVALRYLEQNRENWNLQSADLSDLVVSDQYASQHNGLTHLYLVQRYAGIEVYNAVNGVHIKPNGEVLHATNRFVADLAAAVNTTSPQLSPVEAIVAAAEKLDITIMESLRVLNRDGNVYTFSQSGITQSDIEVKLMLLPNEDGNKVNLVWNVLLDLRQNADYWSMRVDAVSGEVLDQNNFTVYCRFTADEMHTHDVGCKEEFAFPKKKLKTLNEAFAKQTLMGGTYNIFPIPVESPIHGDRQLLVDPADVEASPFGWHDTDGMEGAEYTITHGNNVHAYLDRDGDNASDGGEPDGGEELVFDPFYDEGLEPHTMKEMAVTQLFYMNNAIHDFFWHYGFDEAAGNFQETNYNGIAGAGSDYVLAEAQDNFEDPDAPSLNNANFSTPADGGNGRMQMFLWSNGANNLLTVLSPIEILGGYGTGTAGFGPQINESFEPIEGLLVRAFDGSGEPDKGCATIINEDEVKGKIAVVNRGECFFEEKAVNVEEAGAIALIICNFEEGTIGMGDIAAVTDPTIPTLMLQNSDCQRILQFIDQGVTARIALPESNGPEFLDGDLDNGIIAHEYGHGISNRLTGGPNMAGCLSNDEQMGEGWSDIVSLFMTVDPDDTGDMSRGIGNYAIGANANSSGIRRQPYSTDMNINNQTYDDIIGTTAPHPLGEVWATMLWDLYWSLVEEYGFDEDVYTGTGGNNLAIQLVLDGMKLQPCNPNLIEGRDAILMADEANNGGANECLIWSVFARRGLGWSAEGGNTNDRNDGREAFDPRPSCIKELKITKSADLNVQPGEAFQVVLQVRNDKEETATGVTIVDELPSGLTYVSFTAPTGVTAELISGNQLTFNIGDLPSGEEMLIFYTVTADDQLRSASISFEGAESTTPLNWLNDVGEGSDGWMRVDTNVYEGNMVWFIPNVEADNDQRLSHITKLMVPSTQPVLRFQHSYDTELALDGGIVQISTDDAFSWRTLDTEFFRNGYRGQLAYGTFAIPNLNAFWGQSEGYIGSYIDLSEFADQEINIRFRFGSDAAVTGFGWYIDNIEILDMFNYNSEACVTSMEGDMACAISDGRGTVVEPDMQVSTNEPLPAGQVQVFPNPADELLNVAYEGLGGERLNIRMIGLDGRIFSERTSQAINGRQIVPMDVSKLPAGLYLLQVRTPEGMHTEKVSIQ